MPGPKRVPAATRFRRFFTPGRPDECWEWTGGRAGKGYGQFYDDDHKAVGAHRFAWSLSNGRPVPPGVHVMHSCDNPPCVNPAHLSIGTCADNLRDCAAKGRNPGNRTSRGGRPPKYSASLIAALRAEGMSYREIGALLDISPATALRTLRRG
jgi:hypothetical protein